MKVGGPSAPDPGRLVDQVYGVKSVRLGTATEVDSGLLLDPGRLLKGRVVSVEGTGLLTVATDLGTFTASSATPLEVGREFWFQVVQTGTTPLLAEAGKGNAVMNLLRVLLPGMVAGLEGLGIERASEGQRVTSEAAQLLRFLEENAVAATPDPVKLLKTISGLHLGRPTPEPPLDLLSPPPLPIGRDIDLPVVQKLTRLLEAHALVNQQPTAGVGDYFIYPVFFAEQAGRGEWLFSFDQEADEQDQAGTTATLSFYLAMSRLGDIHLTLTVRPKGMTGAFTLASPEAADHLREHLPQLQEALEPLAGPVTITCRSARIDCLKALKEELTAKAGLERLNLVDVRA